MRRFSAVFSWLPLLAAFMALLPDLPARAQITGELGARGEGAENGITGSGYSLRPPPLSVPLGTPGAVRRSIMQFYNWTLICDTNLADKKQVCNVSQGLWNADNAMIFSWSLAASDTGAPFMLLRTAADTEISAPLIISVNGTDKSIAVEFIGCNEALCMAQTPVGPVLTRAIGGEADVTIAYRTAARGQVRFNTSLRGLKAAVAAIK